MNDCSLSSSLHLALDDLLRHPDTGILPRTPLLPQWRQEARNLLELGHHEEARARCRTILDHAPLDPETIDILQRCSFDLHGLLNDDLEPYSPSPSPLTLPSPPQPIPPLPSDDTTLKHLLNTLLSQVGFRRLQQLGFHLQRNDYYCPLNDCDFLEAHPDLWVHPNLEPPNIDWRQKDQLAITQEFAPFLKELDDVPIHPPPDQSRYGWKNNFWENADALAHYGLVRSRQPARYIEIGCGWSSLLLRQALEHNHHEGAPCQVTLIEPYPNSQIFRHLPTTWTHLPIILQRAPLSLFQELGPGDVLFYDGSHCAKVASDVTWFFFHILPTLAPGVLIHLHDISLPQEYPTPWIFERGQTWNEQYVLQAFLMHNQAYRVVLANRYLFLHHANHLRKLYRDLQPVHGSSFWIEKVEL